MNPYYQDDRATVLHGDCLALMAEMPDASFDAIVTDPPYGLGFMGKSWDDLPPGLEWARECLRLLKPGGHLLAFGGSRTWHRLACAVEDAGFEIRDSIAWLYGSGFPKSLDVSKAIDKRRDWSLVERLAGEIRRARADAGLSLAEIGQATLDATDGTYGKWYHRGGHMFFETGRSLPSRPEWEHLRRVLPIAPEFVEVYDEAEREVTGEIKGRSFDAWEENTRGYSTAPNGRSGVRKDIPATPDAQAWQGWGTALKPAFEPVVVARKPLVGTVAANVLEFGTGALNIDGCRIGHADASDLAASLAKNPGRGDSVTSAVYGAGRPQQSVNTAGRWPANVVLDESQAEALDEQSGTTQSRIGKPRGAASGDGWGMTATGSEYDDHGGASRFFYVAKAPQSERPKVDGIAHPTVKPLALMQWLIRLVTPPGGHILEPFAGSGTTVEAALREQVRITAIEREADYLPLILHRIERHVDAPDEPPTLFDDMEASA